VSGECACSARRGSWGWRRTFLASPLRSRRTGLPRRGERASGWCRRHPHDAEGPRRAGRATRAMDDARLSQRTNRPTAKPLKVCLPLGAGHALTLSSSFMPYAVLTPLCSSPIYYPLSHADCASIPAVSVNPRRYRRYPWPLDPSQRPLISPPCLLASSPRRILSPGTSPPRICAPRARQWPASRLRVSTTLSPYILSPLDLTLPSSTSSCFTASSPTNLDVPALRSQHRLPRSRPRSSTTMTSECGRSGERGCHVGCVVRSRGEIEGQDVLRLGRGPWTTPRSDSGLHRPKPERTS
jgi:hypothetical protein